MTLASDSGDIVCQSWDLASREQGAPHRERVTLLCEGVTDQRGSMTRMVTGPGRGRKGVAAVPGGGAPQGHCVQLDAAPGLPTLRSQVPPGPPSCGVSGPGCTLQARGGPDEPRAASQPLKPVSQGLLQDGRWPQCTGGPVPAWPGQHPTAPATPVLLPDASR